MPPKYGVRSRTNSNTGYGFYGSALNFCAFFSLFILLLSLGISFVCRFLISFISFSYFLLTKCFSGSVFRIESIYFFLIILFCGLVSLRGLFFYLRYLLVIFCFSSCIPFVNSFLGSILSARMFSFSSFCICFELFVLGSLSSFVGYLLLTLL